ncbi:DUF2523 domain-containing protein [Stutzerimonas frequens]|uniref:DUF2523 domain-containing protein n=1 Tax=Stutzerimonas frequens TaxID=2968969 RepID=UPI00190DA26E|nr:DUF2523 domain-containing protein [Stutzerimonas frequens]MBK3871601.1 DUF2523 domain-containing protein [Stutzerimonas frequens]MBK3871604.1 DUF2523 domain-containing protein [Stutzerimonas frequens]MBK3909939.1 DUF2523 domain-containing protein [Stutzerimonas frequens]
MHFYYLAILFLTMVTPLVKMALKALGIGVVAYVGINLVFDQAHQYILNQIGNAPGPAQAILGLAKFDVVINLWFAAITTRLVLSGMNKMSGRKKSMGVLEA